MQLYHVTRKEKLSSILKAGLKTSGIPQGGIAEGIHAEGVYFFATFEDMIEHLGLNTGINPVMNFKDWVLLSVDLPASTLRKFEEYPGLTTLYTTKNVPPHKIRYLGSLLQYVKR